MKLLQELKLDEIGWFQKSDYIGKAKKPISVFDLQLQILA